MTCADARHMSREYRQSWGYPVLYDPDVLFAKWKLEEMSFTNVRIENH